MILPRILHIRRQRLCHARLHRSRDQRLLKVETEVETDNKKG